MRRPQPPVAGAAIGAEHEATAGAAEQPQPAAGAAETGTPEQPQPAAGAAPPKPPSMITPPEEGTELITGAPIAGAAIGAPTAVDPQPQLLTITGT